MYNIIVVNLGLTDNWLIAIQIPKHILLERPDDGLPLVFLTATATGVSNSEGYRTYFTPIDLNVHWTAIRQPFSQSGTLVMRSCISNDGPSIRGGMTARPQPNEEPAITPPWHRKTRTLASLTVYGELFAARTPEEFALVHARLQQEWTFNGGFVRLFTIMLLHSQLIRSSM